MARLRDRPNRREDFAIHEALCILLDYCTADAVSCMCEQHREEEDQQEEAPALREASAVLCKFCKLLFFLFSFLFLV